jgi:hypothetical protein
MNKRKVELPYKKKKRKISEWSVQIEKNNGLSFNKPIVQAESECPPGCFCDTKKGEVLPDHQVSWIWYFIDQLRTRYLYLYGHDCRSSSLDPKPAFHFNADPDPAPHRGDRNLHTLVYRPYRTPF